jgi:hypothetical protein
MDINVHILMIGLEEPPFQTQVKVPNKKIKSFL